MLAAAALALLALLTPGAPCEPPVDVIGHGVPARVVAELSAAAPGLERQVQDALDLSSCAPIRVELLPAIEGADALEPPFHLPGWAAGAAEPGERRIVVAVTAQGERQDRARVLLHELAHLGVREAAGGRPVPRWLDEGIARVLAGEHGSADLSVLARARVTDRLVPLGALADGFPARADLAQLAYAEAGRAVSLMRAGDPRAPARALAAVASGASVDDALEQAAGRRTWQLDVDVARSLPLWRAWGVVGMENDLALALAALGCAWAGLRARRRLHARMTALPRTTLTGPWDGVVLRRWTAS